MMKCKMLKFSELCLVPFTIKNLLLSLWLLEAFFGLLMPKKMESGNNFAKKIT